MMPASRGTATRSKPLAVPKAQVARDARRLVRPDSFRQTAPASTSIGRSESNTTFCRRLTLERSHQLADFRNHEPSVADPQRQADPVAESRSWLALSQSPRRSLRTVEDWRRPTSKTSDLQIIHETPGPPGRPWSSSPCGKTPTIIQGPPGRERANMQAARKSQWAARQTAALPVSRHRATCRDNPPTCQNRIASVPEGEAAVNCLLISRRIGHDFLLMILMIFKLDFQGFLC